MNGENPNSDANAIEFLTTAGILARRIKEAAAKEPLAEKQPAETKMKGLRELPLNKIERNN